MHYMPGDSRLFECSQTTIVVAQLSAQDFLKNQASIPDLVTEAEQLLAAVDLAISGADIPNDEELERMKVSWAFFGNGFNDKIQTLKLTAHLIAGYENTLQAYALLANTIWMLTLRRQTLELNGIAVPLPKTGQ